MTNMCLHGFLATHMIRCRLPNVPTSVHNKRYYQEAQEGRYRSGHPIFDDEDAFSCASHHHQDAVYP